VQTKDDSRHVAFPGHVGKSPWGYLALPGFRKEERRAKTLLTVGLSGEIIGKKSGRVYDSYDLPTAQIYLLSTSRYELQLGSRHYLFGGNGALHATTQEEQGVLEEVVRDLAAEMADQTTEKLEANSSLTIRQSTD
jgi:hypothetical protein